MLILNNKFNIIHRYFKQLSITFHKDKFRHLSLSLYISYIVLYFETMIFNCYNLTYQYKTKFTI